MTILPVALPSASSWTLIDYVSVQRRSAPAAGGFAQLEFDQLDQTEMWLIDHAVVKCDSTTPTDLRWYAGAVADWNAGLQIQPASSLVVRWSGASAGAIGVVTLQARVMRRL
jgi:hypothetical protein